MSLKKELQTWSDALDAYDTQQWDNCIDLFDTIADSSKILFNIGVIQATTGAHEMAVQSFETAIGMDRYLAVAYFQSGVSNFLLGAYEYARRDFEDCYEYLRGNKTIDYEQLGLKFKLYSCEVLFNRGLASIYMGDESNRLSDFKAARMEKQTDEHGVIDDAFADRGSGYTVFSIPVGVLFRPSASKLKNLQTKNYLGAAKLVAATDARDAFTGFTGSVRAGNNSDRSEAPLLTRSQTSGGRIEGGTEPLRWTDVRDRPPVLGRAQTSALPRRNLPGIDSIPRRRGPTPPELFTPPSSEGPLPTLPLHSRPVNRDRTNEPNAYDGADFVSYYADDDPSSSARTPRPRLPASGPTPEGQPIERVAKWARQNVNSLPPIQQNLSRSGTISTSASGHSRNRGGIHAMRSMGMMKETGLQRQVSDAGTGLPYGGYSESFLGSVQTDREMSKVRVKLRYQDDVRGMSITPDTELDDFAERVRVKFGSRSDLSMKYKDAQDGAMVSIIDGDDWESAMDEAREAAKGRAEGKLEIWLSSD